MGDLTTNVKSGGGQSFEFGTANSKGLGSLIANSKQQKDETAVETDTHSHADDFHCLRISKYDLSSNTK